MAIYRRLGNHCRGILAIASRCSLAQHDLAMDQGWSPARAWREHLGLTQAVVAQRLGVSQAAVAQFEAAEAKLKPATRGKLAAALGVSPEQLRW